MAASVTPASASPAAAASAASTAAADDGVPRYYREDTDGDGGDGGAGTAMGRPAVANTEGIPLLTTRAGPPIPVSAAAEDGGVVGVVTGLMSYLLSRPPAADTPAGAAAGTTAAAAATAADAAAASWEARLKEEYRALIVYIKRCAAADAAWVKVAATGKDGVNWVGTCWWYHNNLRYEFVLQLEVRWTWHDVLRCHVRSAHTPHLRTALQIPVGYPAVPPVIILPELLGKTPKMYTYVLSCRRSWYRPCTAPQRTCTQPIASMQRRPHLPQHPLPAAVAVQGAVVWHCTRTGARAGAVAVH